MPALLIWIIRIVSIALVARRAMRGARDVPRMPPSTTVRAGRPGSLQLPEVPAEVGATAREVRAALGEAARATFLLHARDILVLVVAGVLVAGVTFAIIASTR